MGHFLLLALVLTGAAAYFMTVDERKRSLAAARVLAGRVKDELTYNDATLDGFFEVLRARTRWRLVTPLLMSVNTVAFFLGLFQTASTKVTADRWWHLPASMFVHAGILHLVVNLAALLQLGLVLEPAIGSLAFAAIYLSAGVLAGVVNLYVLPASLTAGASGAIFGLYGLLLGCQALVLRRESGMKIPLAIFRKLAPATGLFIVYHSFTNHLASAAAFTGLATGLVAGVVLAREVSERKPTLRLTSAWTAACAVLVGACALVSYLTTQHFTDVRPEIERVIAVENQTAGMYDGAVTRFRKGRITASALATLIDQSIVPTLEVVTRRMYALDHVSVEHQQVVARAEEYLTLRVESWRLRAQALHSSNMVELRQADQKEQASLQLFESVKPPLAQ